MIDPPREYASLHGHSHFSFMDGLSTPEEMILKAKEKGLRSIALTDHGHMLGVADFHIHGKKHDVKTVFGMEAYVIDDLYEWSRNKENLDAGVVDEEATNLGGDVGTRRKALYRKGHMVMLARSQEGLTNLFKLQHKAYRDGFYSKPRIDKLMVDEFGKDIVCSSACMGGVVSNKCWAFMRNEAEWSDVVQEACEWREILGDRFFLELQFNEHESQAFINDCMQRLHRETGIPLTVTTDHHYTNPEEWEAQELLYMLRGKKTIKTRGDDWDFKVRQLFIKGPQEMWEAYERWAGTIDPAIAREAFENTLLIDSMVENFDPDTHQRLPTLDIENPFKRLGELSIARLKELGLASDETYCKRLMHELQLIKDKGFANYFIIMRDIIRKAKEHMLVGPGRGSAAGSLVCYLNGITNLDPIEHNLMFERFINPGRVELPDIDTDFQDTARAKQILREMFGPENVASLPTYSTFNIKGLLKDVCRVYDLDHREINKANKKIESELKVLYKGQDKSTLVIKLEDIERVSPTYNGLCEKFPQIKKHMSMLYGKNRHQGVHACGVVIGDNLPSEMPVFYSRDELVTGYSMGIVNKNVETMGFVKFDLLGLSTLNVIDAALRLICDRHDMSYDDAKQMIDPLHMDLDDPHVLDTVFLQNNFTGIFQFTNKGIRKVALGIGPDCFNDVAAIGALYRPGPLGSQMDKLYADYKHGRKEPEYLHPLMAEILEETHGCLVYQEQMLSIGNKIGKLSIDDTNRLRKLLLKKDKSKKDDYLADEKKYLYDEFVKGCVENEMTESDASKLWKMMEKFGGYGFNASHAKAYGLITMQTAFLRTYYPLEFFAALLTEGKADELQTYVDDVKRQGFKVLPVDINKSGVRHKIEGDAIRLALGSVLGVGPSAAKKILKNQPYTNFRDYLYRTGGSKTATLPLIRVGAFNDLEENSALIERRYELWTDEPRLRQVRHREEFERRYFEIVGIEPHGPKRIIEIENELLGFNLRGSPFKLLGRDDKIDMLVSEGLVMDYDEFIKSPLALGVIPVILKGWNERAQRKGGMFAFMKFADRNGLEFEAPAFATIWKHLAMKGRAVKGNVYLLTVNRKLSEPRNLIVGKPGWNHSESSAAGYLLDVDTIE